MAFLLLLLVLPACAATPQDLSGKRFIFPEETNTANVELISSSQSFTAVTVCFRFITDLSRNHVLFSLATQSDSNAFLIFKDDASEMISLYVENTAERFRGQAYQMNTWHSICATWDPTFDLGQLWLDGKPSIKRYIDGTTFTNPKIILGQEQDSYGGGFDTTQSFVGMMCDVHMWDYVISPCEIQKFMDDKNFTPGNLINWMALEFQGSGRVVIEDKDADCSPQKQRVNK